ncbi:hypothetical protein RND71_007465 [Anisodus tanguticus]|uniref:Helicase C-terminal domain-containing protein n=1 Tax=Anisodus tanguticus TaxID=243964 RepID=A0AAE1SNT9_9SOLA|nr:hypothetical protein RND71_007465 [Anisodus tanguticus]
MAKPQQQQQQQPRSLNQRLLINLSASHCKPRSRTTTSTSSSTHSPDALFFFYVDDMTKLEARRHFNQNDVAPTFSITTDSDSSPSPSSVRISSNVRGNDAVPNFSGIADFSPDTATFFPSGEVEKTGNQSKINDISAFENDAVRNFSAIADFSPDSATFSPSGEAEETDNQSKINNEIDESKNGVQEELSDQPEDSFDFQSSEIGEKEIGQPTSRTKEDPLLSKVDDNSSSLSVNYVAVDMEQPKDVHENCELSQKGQKDHEEISNEGGEKIMKVKIKGRRRLCKISEDNNDSEEMKLKDNEESGLLEITDFDSPPPQVKNAVQNEHAGSGNEIRDILNDLSSRLEILSIEKKRAPKPSDLTKKNEIPEYQSAGFSFSLSSNSSFDSTKESRIGGEIHKQCLKEIDSGDESKSDCVGKFNDTRSCVGAPKRKEVKQMVGKTQPMKNSLSAYKFLEGDGNDSDGDCVVVGDKSAVTQVGRHHRNTRHEPKHSDEFDSHDFVSEEDNTYTLSGPKFNYGLPGKIAKMLYPHQRDGLKWLWSLHCQGKGGILGDDMGLGKTMQICGYLAGLFYSKLIKRVLIVAPKTLLPHWIKELTVVGLSQKIREYYAPNAKLRNYELQYVLQDKGILLTTYDIVRNNVKFLCGDQYIDRDEELTWDYMILDEELWALFNFCCPGLLGDKQWFKEKYEHLILRGNDKNAYDRDKRIGSAVAKSCILEAVKLGFAGSGNTVTLAMLNLTKTLLSCVVQELREHIQPYFLRRLKSEVFSDDSSTSAKLSKKNEIIVWLKLTNCQRQLYTAFLKSEIVLSAFDSSPLAALTILKKICDHPLLLTKRAAEEVLEEMDSTSNQDDRAVAERLVMQMANVTEKLDEEVTHDVSCKITFILALLDNLIPGGHNVLIFSQTRKMLNLLQDALISNGFQFMRLDGTTKAPDRLKIVNDFQEGRGAPIFLLTSQVGGLGLTLTKADRVIVVDPAWNPSTDNQSVDRAYRIGQMKDVVVYRLMTCGTVEEKIYRKQVYKGGLFKTATEHKEQIRYFSQQDLRELFSLPKDGGFDISHTQKQLNEEHDHEQKMEDDLKAHVKFLEKLGIAGVSSHSLLFSKTAPVTAVQDEDEVKTVRERMAFAGNSSSHSSVERAVDAGQYAFKPKDVKSQEKSVPTRIGPTEADIKDKIRRLYQIFANKTFGHPLELTYDLCEVGGTYRITD